MQYHWKSVYALFHPCNRVCDFAGPQCVVLNCSIVPDWCHLTRNNDARSCGVFKVEFMLTNCFQINYGTSVIERIGMFFNGFTWFMKVCGNRSFFVINNVTHRSSAHFKCEVRNVKKPIPIDFMGMKCVSVEYDQPYRWKSFIIYSVRLICTGSIRIRYSECNFTTLQAPAIACELQSTAREPGIVYDWR